jgi:hypothetical protein
MEAELRLFQSASSKMLRANREYIFQIKIIGYCNMEFLMYLRFTGFRRDSTHALALAHTFI